MWIKEYILTIAAVVLLTAFIEALMPSTQMKKHISLVAGVVMILVIAKPVVKLPGYTINDMRFRLEYDTGVRSADLFEKLTESQNKTIEESFSESVKEMIEQDLKMCFKKKYKTEVVVENDTVTVIMYGQHDTEVSDYIKNTYGFKCTFK